MGERLTHELEEMNEQETELPLLDDIHHLTFITADMDRLISFYERVFGARTTVDLEEEGVRHAFIEVGPYTILHPFQVPGVEPPGQQQFFQRGRLDHFALNAASEGAFRELHRRLAAEGTLDSVVTDMGSILLFSFLDPDEGRHEVVWRKLGIPVEAGLRQAEWKTVELRQVNESGETDMNEKQIPDLERMDEQQAHRFLTGLYSRLSPEEEYEFRHEDYVMEMPQSGERFRGRENMRAFQRSRDDHATPPESLRVRRVLVREGLWVVEAVIDYGGGQALDVVVITELRDGKMWRDRWYFAEPFEAPEWRARWVERMETMAPPLDGREEA